MLIEGSLTMPFIKIQAEITDHQSFIMKQNSNKATINNCLFNIPNSNLEVSLFFSQN